MYCMRITYNFISFSHSFFIHLKKMYLVSVFLSGIDILKQAPDVLRKKRYAEKCAASLDA